MGRDSLDAAHGGRCELKQPGCLGEIAQARHGVEGAEEAFSHQSRLTQARGPRGQLPGGDQGTASNLQVLPDLHTLQDPSRAGAGRVTLW